MRSRAAPPPSVGSVKAQTSAVLAAAIVLAGCGQSAADKAQKQVCNSRADIQTQIKTLQQLPVSLSSVDTAKNSLKAIGNDIQQIADAQKDLKGARKQSVQQANQQFKSQIQSIVTSFTTNLNVSDAAQQVQSAATALVTSYKQTLGKVDCSS